jgi:hypothetical protein
MRCLRIGGVPPLSNLKKLQLSSHSRRMGYLEA